MSDQHQTIIEHIALLSFKPDADPSKVADVIDEINALASLDLTIHLSAGKLLRSSLNFTHICHCRFTSMENLKAYNTHPDHLRAAMNIQPIIHEIVVADCISNGVNISDSLKAGSAMRLTLLKLKEGNHDKGKVLEGIISDEQIISVGENLCDEMAKGYSIVMIALFADMEALDSDAEMMEKMNKWKVKDFIESQAVVDYVIPSSVV